MSKIMNQNDPDEYGSDAHKAKNDAQTLRDAEEIRSDSKRHQAAADHLGKMKSTLVNAHANARRSLLKKTGKRLADTFGKHGPAIDPDNDGD